MYSCTALAWACHLMWRARACRTWKAGQRTCCHRVSSAMSSSPPPQASWITRRRGARRWAARSWASSTERALVQELRYCASKAALKAHCISSTQGVCGRWCCARAVAAGLAVTHSSVCIQDGCHIIDVAGDGSGESNGCAARAWCRQMKSRSSAMSMSRLHACV
jgi:hypothetical protein